MIACFQQLIAPSAIRLGEFAPMDSSVRLRLSIMMFLQYAIWGAWAVSMGGYMNDALKFKGPEIGSIYSTTAIAAMISPLFMGVLADKFLATEKVIAGLHLIGAGLLYYAAQVRDFTTLYTVMLAYAFCYMPTLALTNSISFANIGNPERDFPGIRVFGTFGWIVVGWVVGFGLGNPAVIEMLPAAYQSGNAPILLAAILSGLLGLFSFLLPHTPPGRVSTNVRSEASSRSVLQLLQDPTFLIFVISSFLICIPLAFYYNLANIFLGEIKAPYPTALQTIGQISEVGFMAAMPFFIVRLGVKKMLMIGMLAWVVRYFCFASLSFPLVVVGLILHGICYDFFFVASQIYVDNRVTGAQRASAQSFIAFVTLGAGMFVGAYAAGVTLDGFAILDTSTPPVVTGHNWQHLWLVPAIGAGVTSILFWFGFRNPPVGVANDDWKKLEDEGVATSR